MAAKEKKKKQARPPQHQKKQPGIESKMAPQPKADDPSYKGSGKLSGKVALITGGDSGIGRAVAIFFAREGADVAIVYLDEHSDAKKTKQLVEAEGRTCLLMAGDIGNEKFCEKVVEKTVKKLGGLNIVVNNAAVQYPQEKFEDVTAEQVERTFRTNIFSHFFVSRAALKHLGKGDSIISTTSVTAYRGSNHLVDYASTKGAITAFIRSLSQTLAERGIRVNGVAPGPVWTPLIPSSFPADHVAEFGTDVPLGRAGQPEEIAPSYVFLASDDASYMTGQILHPNGGEIING